MKRPTIKPADKPILVCPWTGKELEIVCVGERYWMARGPFWQTQLFDLKEWLHWQLSFQKGVAPAFERHKLLTTIERIPGEPNPVQDLIDAHKTADATSKAIAKEVGIPL